MCILPHPSKSDDATAFTTLLVEPKSASNAEAEAIRQICVKVGKTLLLQFERATKHSAYQRADLNALSTDGHHAEEKD
jgi:hypothetical protein